MMLKRTCLRSIMACGILVSLAACTASEDEALRALRGTGLTNIWLGGYSFFACAADDSFNNEFTASTRDGQPVNGVVCCGWFKGCTVRFR